MSKIYIASRFGRREEVQCLSDDLESLGYSLTGRWYRKDANTQVNYPKFSEEALRNNEKIALDDWDDILSCEIFITLTEDMSDLPAGAARGGRHCEFGLAIAHDKRIIVIGPREHIFHYLPDVKVYNSVAEFLYDLRNSHIAF